MCVVEKKKFTLEYFCDRIFKDFVNCTPKMTDISKWNKQNLIFLKIK